MGAKALARAVQPDAEGDDRAAQRLRGLLCAQFLPRDQQNRLSIRVAKSREGSKDGLLGRSRAARLAIFGMSAGLLEEGVASPAGASLIRDGFPRDAVQPGQWIGRHVVESSPCNRQRLGHNVV